MARISELAGKNQPLDRRNLGTWDQRRGDAATGCSLIHIGSVSKFSATHMPARLSPSRSDQL